jgi:dihydroorotate dehydrogenase (fumarate)
VVFNRFYQPDIDLEELEITPNVLLSNRYEMRVPLTWIGILFGRVKANLAATSGAHNAEDMIKLLMAGAEVTILCSALLRNGVNHIRHVENGIREWMEAHEYESVRQMQGSMSQVRCFEAAASERAQYMRAVKGLQHAMVTRRQTWKVPNGTWSIFAACHRRAAVDGDLRQIGPPGLGIPHP